MEKRRRKKEKRFPQKETVVVVRCPLKPEAGIEKDHGRNPGH